MIYLATSVAVAQLLAEDHRPPAELWNESLVSSRLLEYELWTRLHARALAHSHGDSARMLMARLGFLELAQPVLARALDLSRRPSDPWMRSTSRAQCFSGSAVTTSPSPPTTRA